MARDYELGIVVNPDVGDERARATVERITQTVAANGGQVVRVNAWGRRRLSYPIQHHRDGMYFFFDLIMPPTSVVEIERTLRVNEDIIRHLLTVRDPRIVAQQRQREAEAEAAAEARAAEAAAHAEAPAGEPAAEPARASGAVAVATAVESPTPEPSAAPEAITTASDDETTDA